METLTHIFSETTGSLADAFQSVLGMVSGILPNLVATAIVLAVGLLASRSVKALLHRAFAAVSLDKLAKNIGLADALTRANVTAPVSSIICQVVYWTGLLFTGFAALGSLDVAKPEDFSAIATMIPNVLMAVAILILGLNVSVFIAKLVQVTAVNAEIRQGRLVRNAVHYSMSTLVVILALRQIGIPNDILVNGFLIFFGGTCLAGAIAFGLGGRELAGSITSTAWKQERELVKMMSENSDLGNQILPRIKQRRSKAA